MNITYDCIIVTFGSSFIFLVLLGGVNITLSSTNILYNYSIVTLDGSLIFLVTH